MRPLSIIANRLDERTCDGLILGAIVWHHLDALERFREHLPTVLASSGLSALLSAGRSWTSSGRSRPKPPYLRRLYWSAGEAIGGAVGGLLAAGMVVELLSTTPWAVVTWGGSTGAAVDALRANGLERLRDLALRYLSRVRDIMRGGSRP